MSEGVPQGIAGDKIYPDQWRNTLIPKHSLGKLKTHLHHRGKARLCQKLKGKDHGRPEGQNDDARGRTHRNQKVKPRLEGWDRDNEQLE